VLSRRHYPSVNFGVYSLAMTHDGAPQCERHDDRVEMQLRTMHSDSSRPDTVVGLYECPECGHERRQPIQTEAQTTAA
jgi:hypothetical protein